MDDLLEMLIPPQEMNLIGAYRRFLASDFALLISCPDMVKALKWAKQHLVRPDAETQPVGCAAFSVVTAAIDHFRDQAVAAELASVLVEVARVSVVGQRLLTKLAARPEARSAIARIIIRMAGKPDDLRFPIGYGLITESDVPGMLQELPETPPGVAQEKIAFAIADLTILAAPRLDPDVAAQVTNAAETLPVLMEALKCARKRRDELESEVSKHNANIATLKTVEPPVDPTLDELIAIVDSGEDVTVFVKICYCLCGTRWSPEREIFPGWNGQSPETQRQIIQAAEIYLTRYCVVTDSWIESSEIPFIVTCGYWALRLLARTANDDLLALNTEMWYACLPSVFSEPYGWNPPDDVQTRILRLGYQHVPIRFLELLGRLIAAQNRRSRDASVLDRTDPIWDERMASFVRLRLDDQELAPKAFRRILDTLLRRRDDLAIGVARSLVISAAKLSASELERPIQAAQALLEAGPANEWDLVWASATANPEFADRVFSPYAAGPYGAPTSAVLERMEEPQLAELWSWLTKKLEIAGQRVSPNGPTLHIYVSVEGVRQGSGWYWLRLVVTNALIGRGTSYAVDAIRELERKFPSENLKAAIEPAEEVRRQKGWNPLSPDELLTLFGNMPPAASEKVEVPIRNEGANLSHLAFSIPVTTPAKLPTNSSHSESLPQKRRGAPKKPEAEKTRIRWAELGKPKPTAPVCDQLAEHTYPEDYAKAAPYSRARKKLRDRVARQVRMADRSGSAPAT